ncbi:MAG: peptide chain release factor N(5)-glutamine methyltransferase [Lentimicrobiaceae bacterium]|nr:peptide chain release factor N(5)-glutamine methyltransferase [Lentimicrobiaceae bacterium]
MKIKDLQQFVFLQLQTAFDSGEAMVFTNMLLHHYTGYNRIALNLNPYQEIEDAFVKQIDAAVAELLKHKPIQYILGETEFCGLKIKVNPAVLIPRQETEELAVWVANENPHAERILDLCTGSGCIAVFLAHKLKSAKLTGIDISNDALSVAEENAKLHTLSIDFQQDDVLRTDFSVNKKFDVIVSNPPYVRETERQQMHPRVLDYEPQSALFVDDANPLLFYRAIARIGTTHLSNNGKLYLEINEAYGKETVDLLQQYNYKNITLKKDIHGKDRMVCGSFAAEW